MNRIPHANRLIPITALLAAVSCRDAAPTDPALTGTPPQPQVAQAPDFASLASAIPGLGGLFLDRGVPTVYLTDVADRGPTERALGGFAQAQGMTPSQIQVRQGHFAYRDLERWRRQLSTDAFSIAGVVFTDNDEAANRVTVGVEHAAAESAVRGLAAGLGIPAAALQVQQTEPIGYAATLRDRVRPVVAGLQINFSNFICSIGFNAVSGGQNSFVTASHCTDHQGGVEGTLYYQPLASTANSFIGTEVADPQYFRGGQCPRGRKCRFSDASREAYASGVTFTLGGIAQTTGANNGSLTIAGTLTVTSDGTGLVGQTANKIGRTTGWTQGTITNTCVDTGVQGSNIVQLCQTFVSAGVGGGDSGSDVFRLAGGSSVTLLGVLWGGNSSGTQFVYSPMSGITAELGPLTTH